MHITAYPQEIDGNRAIWLEHNKNTYLDEIETIDIIIK